MSSPGQGPVVLGISDLKGNLMVRIGLFQHPSSGVWRDVSLRLLLFTSRELRVEWILNESWGLCDTQKARLGISAFSEIRWHCDYCRATHLPGPLKLVSERQLLLPALGCPSNYRRGLRAAFREESGRLSQSGPCP